MEMRYDQLFTVQWKNSPKCHIFVIEIKILVLCHAVAGRSIKLHNNIHAKPSSSLMPVNTLVPNQTNKDIDGRSMLKSQYRKRY